MELRFHCFEERLIMTVIVVLSIFSFYFLMHPQSAHANTSTATTSYACGAGPGENHCYAIVNWPGRVRGAQTDMLVRGMGGGTDFVDNELWAIDTNPNLDLNCQAYVGAKRGYCWIEAGYKAYGSNKANKYPNTERWFWSDVRPNGIYFEHPANSALNQGDYGNDARVQIIQGGNQPYCTDSATDHWCIYIMGNSTSFNGLSTGNAIDLDDLKMGLEVSGASGGWANPVHFIYNQWLDLAYNWYFQTNPGVNNPPANYPTRGYWNPQPSSGGTGGLWLTCTVDVGC